MRITFEEEGTGEKFIYDCGWSTGKEILDLLWKKLTLDTFHRGCDKELKEIEKNYGKMVKKSDKKKTKLKN